MIRPVIDYPAIALIWHEANLAGLAPMPALMDSFAVPRSTANNWAWKCRQLGLIPPAPVRTFVGRVGRPPVRQPGTFAPRVQLVDDRLTPAPAVDRRPGEGARVLACDDCDFECQPDHPRDLIRHCVAVHRRPTTRAERTPARAALFTSVRPRARRRVAEPISHVTTPTATTPTAATVRVDLFDWSCDVAVVARDRGGRILLELDTTEIGFSNLLAWAMTPTAPVFVRQEAERLVTQIRQGRT